jgi:hypothetical protein
MQVESLTSGRGMVFSDRISMKHAPPIALILLALAFLASCADPPLEAIAAARSALEAARSDPDVALYAPDALLTAEEALAALQAEIAVQEGKWAVRRSYDRASDLALSAREAGEGSRKQAAAAKEAAGVEAAALIESAGKALSAIELKAGQARRTRGIRLDMSSVIASIVEVRAMLEAARADHASLAFASSRAKAAAARDRIAALDELISEAMLIARKKQ